MMKVFISHKREDSMVANIMAEELRRLGVGFYLDTLDPYVLNDGKELTDHIQNHLNTCTDIIVIMSEATKYSQWVPFEVGMATQKDMPIATYLKSSVKLPEFLEYWPRLKETSDIITYVTTRRETASDFLHKGLFESRSMRPGEIARFYENLKKKL